MHAGRQGRRRERRPAVRGLGGRSGSSTGIPEAWACRHGPSPSSTCSPVTVRPCRPGTGQHTGRLRPRHQHDGAPGQGHLIHREPAQPPGQLARAGGGVRSGDRRHDAGPPLVLPHVASSCHDASPGGPHHLTRLDVGCAVPFLAELAHARGSVALGASALTAAELRLLPPATYLSVPETAAEMFVSRNTVKSHTNTIYRKLRTSSRSQAVSRLRKLGLLDARGASFHPIRAVELTPARGRLVLSAWTDGIGGKGRRMELTVRFQETLRRLAMIDECFVEDEAGLGLGPIGTSALDPKTVALLQMAVSVAIGSPGVCLEWSAGRALGAGATEDEIAEVLLAIAPVAGLGRIVAAAPEVAIALGYDIGAALEELGGP